VTKSSGRATSIRGGLFNVKNAAAYLDTTPDAVRALVKRRQIEFNKSGTGRITFTREQLDTFARGAA
jgi:excisionase family DNA binding protein